MNKFLVVGVCYMPAKAEIEVIANNSKDALEIAEVLLRDTNRDVLRAHVVAGSVDEDMPHSFKAYEARLRVNS